MSQFMLCKTSCNLKKYKCVRIVDCLEGDFIYEVAKDIFGKDVMHNIWNVSYADELFTQAQKLIIDQPFETTELYALMSAIFDVCDTLVLWYSDKYQDLDYASTKEQFLDSVKKSVADSMCECYLYVNCLKDDSSMESRIITDKKVSVVDLNLISITNKK